MATTEPVIALAGNPNCGKTSLFNYITGSRQHVGNYAGVTVEGKQGTVLVDDVSVTFLDLPGTYSLSPYTPEERIAMYEITSEKIDAVIIVADTTRLVRNLYLVSQILEIGKPAVLALNMFDEFEASGGSLDIDLLSELLGIPCVKTIGNRGRGVTELMSTALKVVQGDLPAQGKLFSYSHEMEHAIDRVSAVIEGKISYNTRFGAVQLLHFSDDSLLTNLTRDLTEEDLAAIADARQHLITIEGRDVNSMVTEGRYGFAHGIARECLKEQEEDVFAVSEMLDRVLTHRWFGIPLFLFVLWLMFQATFTLGEYPQNLIDLTFKGLGNAVATIIPPGYLQSLVVDGIIAGVGGVLVFLPNILLLFFFISLMEDTGYMARAAFIMDKLMHACGLHGKSFIPMLVGFGCTVPALMATRTLESKRDRYITMFVIPFMSCGARLPVYVLLTGAFFSPQMAGNVIFSIYLAGIVLAFMVAKVLSMVVKTSTPFVLELPPYRIPTLRSVLLHIWERAWMYLKKAGTVILTFSVIMWVLLTFPIHPDSRDWDAGHTQSRTQLEYSFAGRFGKLIEPLIEPLGFNWEIGVSLTAGFIGKEIVVSTLSTVYSIGGDSEHDGTDTDLRSALREHSSLTPVTAYGMMLFILIYVPCLAVMNILKRETGGWRWVFLMIGYTTGLAWLVTFVFVKTAPLVHLFS